MLKRNTPREKWFPVKDLPPSFTDTFARAQESQSSPYSRNHVLMLELP